MTIAFFDCYSGIAGDMVLGALIDLGIDVNFLKKEIQKIDISGYQIEVKKTKKKDIIASDVYITVNFNEQHHRSFIDIKKIIEKSRLDNEVKQLSKKIFYNLAVAEGKVHKVKTDDVHFHEVGAVDSIIDIIGSAIGIKKLGIKKVYCSKLPLGNGYTYCEHGKISIPAPATKELLKNIPTYQSTADHEMVTPTGAAIITTITEKFGEMPELNIKKIGYGAGKIKSNQPGLLKVIIGRKKEK